MTKRYAVVLRCIGLGIVCWLDPLHKAHRKETFTTRESAEAGLAEWQRRYPMSTYYIHEYDDD